MRMEIQKTVTITRHLVTYKEKSYLRSCTVPVDDEQPIIKWYIGNREYELNYSENQPLWDLLEHKFQKALVIETSKK